MASAPTQPWKSPYITTWDAFQSRTQPTDSAEEAQLFMLIDGVALKSSSTHGMGLVAETFVPRGTVVWHPCRQCDVFAASELDSLSQPEFERLDVLGYYLANGDILLPCRNACRMNHSCDANVL